MRALLEFGGERLRLIVPGTVDLDEVRIAWLHGSDLLDPTPFLEAGQVVLTDGAQFDIQHQVQQTYDGYVARLADRGIAAIGFGSQLVHGRVPPGLIVACEQSGMVLFEMTDLTPYLAYIRFVADAVSNARQARVRWTADAHRSLSHAALRPDGLSAVLAELERLLQARAVLFDASGTRVAGTALASRDPVAEERIRSEVMAVLGRGVHSVGHIEVSAEHYSIQTLPGASGLSGALVVSDPAAPHVDTPEVMLSVTALVTLALAQHRALDRARRHMRSAVLEQLLAGDRTIAMRTAQAAWGGLPPEPTVTLVAQPPKGVVPLLDLLEREAAESAGGVFFALRGERLVVLVESARFTAVLAHITDSGGIAGSSAHNAACGLDEVLDRATHALNQALIRGHDHLAFEAMLQGGLLSILRGKHAGAIAHGLFTPVIQHDQQNGTELMHSLRVWLDHDCAWTRSASTLGIHRHTLAHRIETVGQLLSLDLTTLRDRLEVWAALWLDRDR